MRMYVSVRVCVCVCVLLRFVALVIIIDHSLSVILVEKPVAPVHCERSSGLKNKQNYVNHLFKLSKH